MRKLFLIASYLTLTASVMALTYYFQAPSWAIITAFLFLLLVGCGLSGMIEEDYKKL